MEQDFQGNARFAVRRRLGVGGMGVVYEVFDHERQRPVALKTLRWTDPQILYRFKREFRSLVHIAHPNLVTLHELVSHGTDWMLTMELIDGQPIIDYLRDDGQEALDSWVGPTPTSTTEIPALGPASPPPDLERLEDAFRQLALGTHALHEAGKLHRDIKPSNVLVDREGRVVLLDFGLVTDLARSAAGAGTTGDNLVGTASYMSPEQALSAPAGAASDWYSVGVMLFEALTGVLPHQGAPLEILMQKQQRDAPAPRTLLPQLPTRLSDLCVRLLARDPLERPSGEEIIFALGGPRMSRPATSEPARTAAPHFVGRKDPLKRLRRALAATRDGRPAVVLVHGASGMGKSALISRFAEFARHESDTEVIVGRCYEAESVPFKALDDLIDGLASRLAALPRERAEAIVPRDRGSLVRLFPALRRVSAIAEAPRHAQTADSHELRARATAALAEMLGRYATKRPVALVIDDMQWGDVDSADLLFDVLRGADPPALLVVITFRTAERETSPALRHFLALCAQHGKRLIAEDMEIGPLSHEESVACGLSQLEGFEGMREKLAHSIADESHGNPFIIDELVRYLHAGLAAPEATGEQAPPAQFGVVSLDEALRGRLDRLEPAARLVLELTAVAARPVSKRVLYRAAGLDDSAPALAMLRAGSLVRMSGARGADMVETMHDRVRKSVVDGLGSATLVERHRQLARTLRHFEEADPEHLAFHFRGAGDLEQAGAYAAAAAQIAFDALAFERSATLFRTALAELPADDTRRSELTERLGDAEWSAGRLAEAAAAYLAAAEDASPGRALELKRRASEQLLRSAHVDEGLAVIGSVLSEVSLVMAPTPRRALLSLLWKRVRVRLRGLAFRRRDASELAATTLARLDTCWSVASTMGPIDTIRGAALQTMHLLLALSAGEVTRVSRALGIEAGYSAVGAKRTEARTRRLVTHAREFSRSIDHLPSVGIAQMADCLCEYQLGNWRLALERGLEASATLENECTGMYFEIATVRRWILDCLFNLGELSELSRHTAMWLRDAERRGDAHLQTELATGLPSVVGLMRDDPEGTRARAQAAIDKWPKDRFLLQHYTAGLADAHALLYQGEGTLAYQRVLTMWRPLKRALLLKIQALEAEAWFLRGRAAVAASLAPNADHLGDATRCANKLARLQVPGGPGLAEALRAMIEDARGATAAACARYHRAAALLEQADLKLFAASVRLRGGILGGPGSDEAARAQRWFEDHDVMVARKLAGVFAPGR